MIVHLLRLVWNRKRQNLLLTVEIFLSFIVLFAIVWTAVGFAGNWRQPLGYDIDRVWSVRLRFPPANPEISPGVRPPGDRVGEMLATVRMMPNVEAAAAGFTAPYVSAGWNTEVSLADGRDFFTNASAATDDFAGVMNMKVTSGRWFSRNDEGMRGSPVVLNARLAREIFGDGDPIGQTLDLGDPDEQSVPLPWRVVGVVEDFRRRGEFEVPGNFIFHRMKLEGLNTATGATNSPNVLVVRVAAGTPAEFEAELVRQLQEIAPDWSLEARLLEDLRRENHRGYVEPLAIFGIVAVFLLLMVALGLTGVVWQSITSRTREFGLRRAKGATAADVQRQVLTEVGLLTSLAVAIGVALLVQIPLLPLPPPEAGSLPGSGPGTILPSIVLTGAVIYLLTLACAWYPSRLATRIQPADALHYE
jgi:putative ABC transport system permease protein